MHEPDQMILTNAFCLKRRYIPSCRFASKIGFRLVSNSSSFPLFYFRMYFVVETHTISFHETPDVRNAWGSSCTLSYFPLTFNHPYPFRPLLCKIFLFHCHHHPGKNSHYLGIVDVGVCLNKYIHKKDTKLTDLKTG